MLAIPEGCAHCFQVFEADSEILYLSTAFYQPGAAEGAVACNDPRLHIDWPTAITELSERDRNHPQIAQDFAGIVL